MHKRIVITALAALVYFAPPAKTQQTYSTPSQDPCQDPVYLAMRRVDVGLMTKAEYEAFHLREYACRQYVQARVQPTFRVQTQAPQYGPTIQAVGSLPTAYRKDPAAATLFSLPLAGAGHLYTGETGKGATILGLYVLGQIVTYAAIVAGAADLDEPNSDAALGVALGGLTVSAVSWIYGVVDARPSARRMNRLNGYSEPAVGGVRR